MFTYVYNSPSFTFFSDFQKGTISPELCNIFKMRSKLLKWDTFSHNILKIKIKKKTMDFYKKDSDLRVTDTVQINIKKKRDNYLIKIKLNPT